MRKTKIRKGLNYRLAPLFLKRKKVLDDNGKWVDTSPLILNSPPQAN